MGAPQCSPYANPHISGASRRGWQINGRHQRTFRHSTRNLPYNSSMNALSGMIAPVPSFRGLTLSCAIRASGYRLPSVDMAVASGVAATIGDICHFTDPQKLVNYLGLNPSVRQSGESPAYHGRITKQGRGQTRGMLVEAAWAATRSQGLVGRFISGSLPVVASILRPSRQRGSWQ